MHLSYLSKTSR